MSAREVGANARRVDDHWSTHWPWYECPGFIDARGNVRAFSYHRNDAFHDAFHGPADAFNEILDRLPQRPGFGGRATTEAYHRRERERERERERFLVDTPIAGRMRRADDRDLRRAASRAGSHFFSPENMRGFRSRVSSECYSDDPGAGERARTWLFVTSEPIWGQDVRTYFVRVASVHAVHGFSVDILERFGSRNGAIAYMRRLAGDASAVARVVRERVHPLGFSDRNRPDAGACAESSVRRGMLAFEARAWGAFGLALRGLEILSAV